MIMDNLRVCSKCGKENPTSEYRKRSNKCRSCRNKYALDWGKKNPEKLRGIILRSKLNGWNERRHGITPEEYNRMFIEQNGMCAICGVHQSKLNKRLCIDHDHSTGKIRGLLCNHCNFVIGHAHDNPDILMSAIVYLKK